MSSGLILASVERLLAGLAKSVEEILADRFEGRAGDRDLQVLGTVLVGRDERQVDLGLHLLRQLDLGLLGGFLEPLQCHRVAADVDSLGLLELIGDEVDEPLVEVVAAEVPVAVARQHLEDAVADVEDRDVERAATEVEDRDAGVLLLLEAVGEGRGGRLVDDPLDLEARDLAGVLGRLPLCIVEVGGDRDDRAIDRLAEVLLRRLLQITKDHRRHLRRRVLLVADLDGDQVVAAADHAVGNELLLVLDLVVATSHEPLDREDGVAGIGDLLVPRRLADEAIALVGEADHRGGGPVPGRVDDDGGPFALHDRDHRVGGAEVDSDDLAVGF